MENAQYSEFFFSREHHDQVAPELYLHVGFILSPFFFQLFISYFFFSTPLHFSIVPTPLQLYFQHRWNEEDIQLFLNGLILLFSIWNQN
jgi:hypothetical protein